MSRTVLGLVAVGAAILASALVVAWYAKMHERAVISHAAAPTAARQPLAPIEPPKQATATAPAAAVTPTFDVARIGRDGHAVIAGRAAPGAKIVLLDVGKEIAHGQADAQGEWVLLIEEPPLAPGKHELQVVQQFAGQEPVKSDQAVIAMVPERSNSTDETLVVIAPPDGAATLVQPSSPAGVPRSSDLVLSTLDYDSQGHVIVTGQAPAGAAVRVYIDDKLVGEALSSGDSRWRSAPADAIGPGKHVLRLDQLAKDGKPAARLELSFERLTAPPALGDHEWLSIVKGDNLWNIARAHYGQGWQYTVIFNANKDQIRDPNLIYPGQIFSLPKVN